MNLPKIQLPKKPTYITLAHDVDFCELFKKIEKQFDNCYLFESLGEPHRASRYSVMGFGPKHIIRAKNKDLFFDDQKLETDNPYYALRQIAPQDIISRRYAGGLVGYMSYEAVNYIEPSVNVKVHERFDQFMFGVYTDGLVLDSMTNELFYFFYDQNRLERIQQIMKQSAAQKPMTGRTAEQKSVQVKFKGDNMTRDEHAKVVNDVKEKIRGGYTFQCEVGFKSEYEIQGDCMQVYEKLRAVNPSPYMYYVKFGGKKIIGASPERLFSLVDGQAETHPLAGTIRRGENELQDKRLAREMFNDPKEAAEHNMLVDMHRNDIGRISQFGTVKIQSLMDIKKFQYVQHIGTEISGIIDPSKDMFDGLASLLPGGVLCGAPKVETIKIIDQNESQARGPYGGAVGSFGFNGDCTFAIPIRTLFVDGSYAYTQTCSGIVYDSQPDKEYHEIVKKLEGMKRTLDFFQ
ncbi:MAG: anthranilate synthase component I [Candidatus Magasanikbacteria bacterium CG10_big_fil_rev_8_21_14_0_10_40_10]|uniref:Anthranilate synthase component I n=1 Tax=Candidatus Magasanikbacteria bacterium CG10_big_fil_rev_8_21_14_0_10_40_10 TaxID=1974648 RepID=A0A2M6W481_9BACT|nr:MAG: anthranilate synthase component I [Candidatus Magasanikbacteria bacterium CG10_big_fil_rev_8_21_14_0_10_40_10]